MTNGDKAKRDREKALKNKTSDSGGGGSAGAAKRTAAMDLKCTVCMQCFPNTQKKAAMAHAESKHPKSDFMTCFPMCEAA